MERRARKTPLWVSFWSSWRQGAIWDVAHFVGRGWHWDGFLRVSGNAAQFLPELQSIEALADELRRRLPRWAILFPELVGKFQILLGDRFGLGKAIRLVLRQDVPDFHEQFSCNGNNRLVSSHLAG